jgi:2-polyprenyl-3-methyl-5-hydroxy-6-metoxy-1,4-benzoquinol methylase
MGSSAVAGGSRYNSARVKSFDRTLQRWRIRKVAPHLAAGGRVFDVGCADGALFRQLADAVREGVGVDPDLPQGMADSGHLHFVRGRFPEALDGERPFDSIAMLAILEHMEEAELRGAAGPATASCVRAAASSRPFPRPSWTRS